MKWDERQWRETIRSFQSFIEPLVAGLGRSERREGAALYLQGLLMPGHRKSIEPMAERLQVDSQKLQQFLASSPWDAQSVWQAIRRDVVPLFEPLQAWIVDETGWLKQGKHSVGVSHQYCGAVGKQAQCQVSVELVVSDGEIAAPVGAQLYLPEGWIKDATARKVAGVPKELQFQTKPEIAISLIQSAVADGLSKAPVLGDAVYGNSWELRNYLRQAAMEYFFHAENHWLAWDSKPPLSRGTKLWTVDKAAEKATPLLQWAKAFPPEAWTAASWDAADGEKRHTRLAWRQIYLNSDLEHDTGNWPNCWLVVDWPDGNPEPYHVYVAELRQEPSKGRALRLSRGRWPIEQYFQRGKEDLGLDHYEGRSWRGLHHHMVLSAVAYLFVVSEYQRSKKNFRPHVGNGTALDPAVHGALERVMQLLRK